MESGVALKRGIAFPWMFSRELDVLFYFAPVLVGLLAFSLSQSPLVGQSIFWAAVISSGFGAGPFHGGPTWFVYFDRKNLAHYASSFGKWCTFFLFPPLILFLTIVGMLYLPHLTHGVYIFWTIQHLVQQNVGLLLLYHNHGRGEAIVNRRLEISTLYAATICCTLIMVERLNFLKLGSLPGLELVILGSMIWLVCACVAYAATLARKVLQGESLNMPAFLFWMVSILFFLPLTFMGRSSYQALLIPLTLHWFQYIGLNFVLVKRKYASADEVKNLPVARPIALLAFVCITMTIFIIAMNVFQLSDNGLVWWQRRILGGIVIGLSLVHYYLDAFIWRFREPYQRQTILPYLVARS